MQPSRQKRQSDCAFEIRLRGTGRSTSLRFNLQIFLLLCLIVETPLLGKTNYKKWLNQEVIWIISEAERQAFQKLNDDEAREEFIARFWLRRDPTPSTDRNEYLDEHYRRLIFANKMFQEGTPGWKTDRGRIYILHGPPDAEYYFNSRSAMSPDRELPSGAQSPNTIIWVYHQNKNAKYYKGEIRVVFQPSSGLSHQSFALSDSKTGQERADQMSRLFFPASNPNWMEADVRYQLVMAGPPRVVNAKGADLPTAGLGELNRYMEDLTRSPGEVLEERESSERERSKTLIELRNATTSEVSFGDLPFELTNQSYYQPSGNWLFSFGVTIPADVKGTEFQIYAVLLHSETGKIFDEFMDTIWRHEVESGSETTPPTAYLNSFSAPSGKFRLRIALRETDSGITGYKEEGIELKPLTTKKLELGTVMLTNRVEVLPEASAAEGQTMPTDDHSIVFQNVRLLPSNSDSFATGSLLFLFLQVWVDNPEAAITLNANFIRDGQIVGRLQPRAIETGGQSYANHGTIVPLTDLAAGDYMLQLQLIEHTTKTFEIRRIPVTLVEPLSVESR